MHPETIQKVIKVIREDETYRSLFDAIPMKEWNDFFYKAFHDHFNDWYEKDQVKEILWQVLIKGSPIVEAYEETNLPEWSLKFLSKKIIDGSNREDIQELSMCPQKRLNEIE